MTISKFGDSTAGGGVAGAAGINSYPTKEYSVAISVPTTEPFFGAASVNITANYTYELTGVANAVNGIVWHDYSRNIDAAQVTYTPETDVSRIGYADVSTTAVQAFQPQTSSGASVSGLAHDIKFLNGKWIITNGNGDRLLESADRVIWTTRPTGTNAHRGIVWTGTYYVVPHSNGNIRYSTNLVTWTSATSNLSAATQIADGGPEIIVVGDAGKVRSSTDGVTWTTVTVPWVAGTWAVAACAYGNGHYLVGSSRGEALASTDLVTWTTIAGGSDTEDILSISADNGYYAIAQDNRNVRWSTDVSASLSTWNQISGTTEAEAVRIDGDRIVARGIVTATTPGAVMFQWQYPVSWVDNQQGNNLPPAYNQGTFVDNVYYFPRTGPINSAALGYFLVTPNRVIGNALVLQARDYTTDNI